MLISKKMIAYKLKALCWESSIAICAYRVHFEYTIGELVHANLQYVCMEVRMSPLSIAWAPHYVKEEKLGHSHFLGQLLTKSGWT